MRSFMKFFKWPMSEKMLFTEALIFLYLAKGMLLILPYKICLRTIGQRGKSLINEDTATLKKIKVSLFRANKFAVWKNVCLVQSFAGRWMLNRRNIVSEFMIGVNYNSDKKLIAHAWLLVNNFEIVAKDAEYTTLIQH